LGGQTGTQGILHVVDQVGIGTVKDRIRNSGLHLELVPTKGNLIPRQGDLLRGLVVPDEGVIIQRVGNLGYFQALDIRHADDFPERVPRERLMDQFIRHSGRQELFPSGGLRCRKGTQNVPSLIGHGTTFDRGANKFGLGGDQFSFLVFHHTDGVFLLDFGLLFLFDLVMLLFQQFKTLLQVRFFVLQFFDFFLGDSRIGRLVHQLLLDVFQLITNSSQLFFQFIKGHVTNLLSICRFAQCFSWIPQSTFVFLPDSSHLFWRFSRLPAALSVCFCTSGTTLHRR